MTHAAQLLLLHQVAAAAAAATAAARPSKTYRLSETVSVEAFAPVVVTASHNPHEFVWYPKTLAWLGPGRLLLSHSTHEADGAPPSAKIGVSGEVFTSTAAGREWQRIDRPPVYGCRPGLTHCQRAPSGGVASCMAGESSFWQPAGTAQKPREGLVLVQHFNASTGAYLGSSCRRTAPGTSASIYKTSGQVAVLITRKSLRWIWTGAW